MGNTNNKFIGCIMIIIGTAIGAGILGFATESAGAGFPLASVMLIFTGIITIITAYMIIEVNLALPGNSCSFSSMAEQTLGTFGKIITWISYLFLLYFITWAYMAGGASVITKTLDYSLNIQTPNWVNAVLFTVILGAPVFLGTKVVDYFNRGLMSVKGLLLLATIALIMPHVEIDKLVIAQNTEQTRYLGIATPLFIFALFFHPVIPSLRGYIGDQPRMLKKLVTLGIVITLVIYVLWLAATLGVVPVAGDNSFISLAKNGGSVGEFAQTLSGILNNKWAVSSLWGFSNISMTTSFLGVSLSLFDFLADGFKISDTRLGRSKTALLTFVPPLVLALLFPQGFMMAIRYTSFFVVIISIILPPLMVYNLRKSQTLKSPYRVFGGNTLLALVLLTGIVFLVLTVTSSFNLLPSLAN